MSSGECPSPNDCSEVLRVPRVLIADDNSNVQKMVALALKEAGIEVIAVGNGEAAVRKMAEVNPDLVLADIFMPVRSGYEVCEFVKHDPRYMHTPVVLLVGAFDPLDEREAQRVQADGVLKKPFVPPEPLVNMVMGLLVKSAAERSMAVSNSAPDAEVAVAKEPMPAPPPVKSDESRESAGEQPAEELASPAAAVVFAENEKPLAFSSLLEAPPVSGDETDPIVTATRDPSLGEPAFWTQPPAAPGPSPEELTEGHAWDAELPRRNSAGMLGPEEPQADESEEFDEVTVEFDAAQESAEGAQESEAEPAALVDTTRWTETPPDLVETEPEPSSSLSETSESEWRQWAAETTTAPEDAAPPQAEPEARPEAQAEPVAMPEVGKGAEEEVAEPVAEAAAPAEPESAFEHAGIYAAIESFAAEQTPSTNGAMNEVEVKGEAPAPETVVEPMVAKAAEIEPVAAAQETASTVREKKVELLSVHEDFPAMDQLWKSAEPTFPWADAEFPGAAAGNASRTPNASNGQGEPEHASVSSMAVAVAESSSAESTAAASADAKLRDAEFMEAVVERVLERMQPRMVEIFTQEILRPVVEAMVRRELERP